MPIQPDLIEYETSLASRTALVFTAGVLGLVPGTLVTEVKERRILIHSLVGERQARENARELEEKVADLFGLKQDRA